MRGAYARVCARNGTRTRTGTGISPGQSMRTVVSHRARGATGLGACGIGSTLSAGGSAWLASGQPATTHPTQSRAYQSRARRQAQRDWHALCLLAGRGLSQSSYVERRRSVWEHMQDSKAALAGPGCRGQALANRQRRTQVGLLTLRLRAKAPTKGICVNGANAAQLGVARTVQTGAANKGTRTNGLKGRRQGDAGQGNAAIKGKAANGLEGRWQVYAGQADGAFEGKVANGLKGRRAG